MSHLYSCRERVSAAAAPYTSRSLSLGACVPVRARAPTRSQRATASKQCPALSLYCCLLAAERIFQSKRGKNIKRSRNGCMDFGLAKTSVKMAFRSLCRGRIPLLTSSSVSLSVCATHFSPSFDSFLFYFCGNIKQRILTIL